MGRERRILFRLLVLFVLCTHISCVKEEDGAAKESGIKCGKAIFLFNMPCDTDCNMPCDTTFTKAQLPPENLISDVNIVLVDEYGAIEDTYFYEGSSSRYELNLVKGKKFDAYILCNWGYKIDVKNLDALLGLNVYMAYPDEYSRGVPMCAVQKSVTAGENYKIDLVRLISKITLQIDRSQLNEDVSMHVRNVKIVNCPKRMRVFQENIPENKDWYFANGFEHKNEECDVLNQELSDGESGVLSLYMLENMKESDAYIELAFDYASATYYSQSKGLIYRFYIGEKNNKKVERNCMYRLKLVPNADGLGKEGWEIDKSNLSAETSFKMEPSGYLEVHYGDRIHVRASLTPPNAPFEISRSNLENDRETGIYNYTIDEDGKGVVLDIIGYGVGLVYMEAGEPINDAGLLYIHVIDDRGK